MTTSVMSFKRLVRKGSHAGGTLWKAGLRHKGSLTGTMSNSGGDTDCPRSMLMLSGIVPSSRRTPVEYQPQSNSLVDYSDSPRTVVLEKQDNETFGFEIQTKEDMCTFVYRVNEDSPAENAGLKTGEVIVTVNGVRTEGSPHQQIVDLIRESATLLRMETMSAASARRFQLNKKLKLLQCQLSEKQAELQALASQEERLAGGKQSGPNPHPSQGSLMSLSSLTGVSVGCPRFCSDSSRSLVMGSSDDSDSLCSALEDLGPFTACSSSSDDSGCFFSSTDLTSDPSTPSPGGTASHPCPSPPPTAVPSQLALGTLRRRSRRASIRDRIMMLIPVLNRSLEEEEEGEEEER